MVGRARPFARLAGIVDAADVMTSEQPAVALVSGEAGIGKTRLVREASVESLPSHVNTIAVTAQPGSMGRPLDAVTGLVDPSLSGDDVAGAVFELVAAAAARGPALLVIEDLHWIDTASANLVDRLAQQPWPSLLIVATYRPDELSARAAGRRARAAPRAPPFGRAGPARPARSFRGWRDGLRDRGDRRRPAFLGVRRGTAPPDGRGPVRRRGADAGRRSGSPGVGGARRRVAVVAGRSGAPAARRARRAPPACRRGARGLRPGGFVRGSARRDRGRGDRTSWRPCGR